MAAVLVKDRRLPTDPEARNVAGYVARRSTAITKADPPPPSKVKPKNTKPAEKGRRKKNRAIGGDEEDGSESDGDEKKQREVEITRIEEVSRGDEAARLKVARANT